MQRNLGWCRSHREVPGNLAYERIHTYRSYKGVSTPYGLSFSDARTPIENSRAALSWAFNALSKPSTTCTREMHASGMVTQICGLYGDARAWWIRMTHEIF